MSIYRSSFFPHKLILNSKYLVYLKNRNTYLFLLGLSLSVGDVKLIIATSIFAGIILASYRLKYFNVDRYLHSWQKVITPQNKQLILSVFTAGTLAITSYLILNIWTEIDNKWLAFGIIWQILFSTMGVGFLGWKLNKKSLKTSEKYSLTFSELIKELNDSSPLQRLWAINQIMNLWENDLLTKEEIKEIKEYFNLLRDLETEIIILNKLNNCLEKLAFQENKPLQFPKKINQKLTQKIIH